MSTQATYAHFLVSNGVPPAQAATVAASVIGKTDRQEPLTEPVALLTATYLTRSGANPAAEQYLERGVTDWAGTQTAATAHTPTSGLPSGKRFHKPFSPITGRQAGHMTVLVDGIEVDDSSAQYRTVITKLATAAGTGQNAEVTPENVTLNFFTHVTVEHREY